MAEKVKQMDLSRSERERIISVRRIYVGDFHLHMLKFQNSNDF